MIKMIRLDERLIHGQVATKWSRLLDVDRILVADDEAAENELVKKSLMMAAPSDCKTTVVSVDSAIRLCNDPRAQQLKILLIVSTPENLLKVTKEVQGIEKVNIGNYGRIASKINGQIRDTYTKNLYLYSEEAEILKQVIMTGTDCVVQTIPDETSRDLSAVLQEKERG